jgi:Spy/CpxP family protein refolding chaperone
MSEAGKHWRIWTSFFIVFASGIAIGIVIGATSRQAKTTTTQVASATPKNLPQKKQGKGCASRMRGRLLAHFANELELTSEQKTKVNPILKAMTEKIDAIHRGKYPEIQKTIASSMGEIEKVLSPKQKKELDALRKKILQRGKCRESDACREKTPNGEPKPRHKGNSPGRGKGKHGRVTE